MLESRRQAEQRRARMFGRPANAANIAASTPNRNGDGAGGPQTSAPTDATGQQFEDIFGEVIPFPELPRGPSPLFARLKDKIEPLGAGIHEPDEHGDGGQEPEYDTPAGDDVAPPPAHYTPMTTSLPCYSNKKSLRRLSSKPTILHRASTTRWHWSFTMRSGPMVLL